MASITNMKKLMFNDLQVGIDAGANFMVALALSTYTEVWGRLVKGVSDTSKPRPRRGSKSKHKPEDTARDCYEAFFSSLGDCYADLIAKGVPVYHDIRCGLVHSYAIEGTADIGMASGKCGITYENGKYVFYILTYFEDFKKAVEDYLHDVQRSLELQAKLRLATFMKPQIR